MAKPDDRMARGKWPGIAGAALPRMYQADRHVERLIASGIISRMASRFQPM
jgi:hypothetical protein